MPSTTTERRPLNQLSLENSERHDFAPPSSPARKFCIRCSRVPWLCFASRDWSLASRRSLPGRSERRISRERHPIERFVEITLLELTVALRLLRECTGETVGRRLVLV